MTDAGPYLNIQENDLEEEVLKANRVLRSKVVKRQMKRKTPCRSPLMKNEDSDDNVYSLFSLSEYSKCF